MTSKTEANKFVNPSLLYELAKKEDKMYFRCYPVLNQRLGPVAGTLLNYLLNQQWRIEQDERLKRRFPHYFQSTKQLANTLGFSQKKVKEALHLLRDNELVMTVKKGWPAKNNFMFDQKRIMDVILASPCVVNDPSDQLSSNT
jgi:hypothetical protein